MLEQAKNKGDSLFQPKANRNVPRGNGFQADEQAIGQQNEYSSFYLSYDAFKERFLSIPNLKDAALIATIYCGYARVGEIVRGRYQYNPPLSKSQVEFTDSHMILSIKTEKTRQWRKVPTSRAIENWLHKPIQMWLDNCGNMLFPYSTRWAEKHFQRWFGTQHIHLLRHWATTHALQKKRTKKPLQPQEIARLGGWTNLNTFYKIYSHFIVEDFIHKV